MSAIPRDALDFRDWVAYERKPCLDKWRDGAALLVGPNAVGSCHSLHLFWMWSAERPGPLRRGRVRGLSRLIRGDTDCDRTARRL